MTTLTKGIERARVAYRAALPVHRLHRYIGRAADVFTYTSVPERLMLFEEALSAGRAPEASGLFLEVGSHLGASAVVLAEALRWTGHGDAGRVFCIDTWRNDTMPEGRLDTYQQFLENTSPWSDLVAALRGNSQDAEVPCDGDLDLVFIDGDHSYEAVRSDVDRFAPKVAPHGRLLLHDHRSMPGVTRVLGEVLASGGWVIQRCVESLVSLRRVDRGTT